MLWGDVRFQVGISSNRVGNIFFVMVEEFGIHGNVSHEHEVKIRLRGVGIVRQTDFEVFDIIPVGDVSKSW